MEKARNKREKRGRRKTAEEEAKRGGRKEEERRIEEKAVGRKYQEDGRHQEEGREGTEDTSRKRKGTGRDVEKGGELIMLVMMRKIYVNTFHNLLFLLGQKPGVPGATKNSANGKSGAVKPNQLSNPLVDGGQAGSCLGLTKP